MSPRQWIENCHQIDVDRNVEFRGASTALIRPISQFQKQANAKTTPDGPSRQPEKPGCRDQRGRRFCCTSSI
jgi:hypothetical protein